MPYSSDGPTDPSRDSQEGTPIDIIFLVERLESLIANGKKLPLTTNVVVDQNAALGLIDELRVAVPEEVRAAKRINSEGERIIEKAQEEAERIVAKAQEQAAFLIDERGLTQAAEALRAAQIIADAQRDADEIRRGADEYAVGVLVGLEGDVVKTLQSIKKGIALLDERRATLRRGRPTAPTTSDEALERAMGGRGRPSRRRQPAVTVSGRTTGRSSGTSPGCSSDDPGADRDLSRSRTSRIDLGEDLALAEPIDGRVRLARTNRGILADADLQHGARARVQPLPARHRVPDRRPDPGGVPAGARPGDRAAAAGRRRARRRSA